MNDTITVGGARTETISGDDSLKVKSDRSEVVSGDETIRGTHVAINGASTCAPAAQLGDLVDSVHILTRSATACSGG